MINLKLLEFALGSISARKGKYIFISLILTLIIFLSASVFYITGALRLEASYTLDSMPDIIVQKQTAGQRQFIRRDTADRLLEIPGVSYAVPRIWGTYRYEYLNSNITIVGVDVFAGHLPKDIETAVKGGGMETLLKPDGMITGAKLADTLRHIYNHDEFSFQKPDGGYISMKTGAVFRPESGLISSSVILMNQDTAAEILGIDENRATDIAVFVPNPEETDTIAEKIAAMAPDTVIITKEKIKAMYQNMFDYKSGIFLLIFSVCLFTFFIIAADRFTGIGREERKEIAVLKALGYTVSDILKIKFYEAAAVAVFAFLLGIFLALPYVFVFHAPLLKNVFTGYSYLRPEFVLPFSFSVSDTVIIFLSVAPVYTASVIIPAWKSAVTDAGESIR